MVARGSLIFMFGLVVSANLFSGAVRDGFDRGFGSVAGDKKYPKAWVAFKRHS